MANDITTTKAGPVALSNDLAARLVSGIAESRASTPAAGGGMPFLRMLKSGEWVYGAQDEAVQDGSRWAINPLTISHGYVAWTNHPGNTKNTMVGEVMAPVFEHKPARPPAVDGWPFAEQRALQLRCLNGEDEGTEVVYKTASHGGMKAVDGLLKALQNHLTDPKNNARPCPVVTLGVDHYQHTKYGKTYTPELVIESFVGMNGEVMPETEADAQGSLPLAPPVAAAAKARKAPVEPEAPAPTAARRRPAAR